MNKADAKAIIRIYEKDTVLKIQQAGNFGIKEKSMSIEEHEKLIENRINEGYYNQIFKEYVGGKKPYQYIRGMQRLAFHRSLLEQRKRRQAQRKRGVIENWTYPARRRTNIALRNGMSKMQVEFVLTMPGENPCKDGKKIKKCLDKLESEFRKREINWFWIQEWQKRDAWHGHVCLSKWIIESWLRQTWSRIVLEIHPGISEKGKKDFEMFCLGGYRDNNGKPRPQVRRIEQKKFYAMYLRKYMGKDENKVVPEGFINPGRFSGWSAGFLTFVEKSFNPNEGLGKIFVRYARRHRKAEMRSWSTGHFKKKKFEKRFMPGTVGFVHWNGAGFVKKFNEVYQPGFLKNYDLK